MKCANCGEQVRKHDCETSHECLELTSLSLIAMGKEVKKIKKKVVKVIEQGIKIEKKVEKLKEKIKNE